MKPETDLYEFRNPAEHPSSMSQVVRAMVDSIPYLFLSKDQTVLEYNVPFAKLADFTTDKRGEPAHVALGKLVGISDLLERAMAHSSAAESQLILVERMPASVHLLVDIRKVEPVGFPGGWLLIAREISSLAAFETQYVRNDKLATAGKIAAGIAHEIRNPLTSIRGFLQILQAGFEAKELAKERAFSELMVTEIDRVNHLVNELLLLAKPSRLEMEILTIDAVLQDIMPLVHSDALLHNVQCVVLMSDTPAVRVDRNLLKQVLFNLVTNALEAMEDGGTLTISSQFDVGERRVRVDVTDTGPGIPHYMVDRIFDAFYTTKETGIGLGLPICQRIIAELGGEMRVAAKGFGATFSIYLPPAEGPAV